jgi:phosphate transport system substrate-binding protein
MDKKLTVSVIILMTATLVLSACGTAPINTAGTSNNGAATDLPAGSVQINGAGSTFQQPVMSQWAYSYSSVDPSVVINYQGTGSGAGKTAIIQNTVDFAGSDSVLTSTEMDSGPDLQMFPILAGAVVLTYNIPELDPSKDPALILDGNTLVGIYNATITSWNDPAILALNPQIASKLPDQQITVVHRSDGSGTTEIFTNALTAFNSAWTAGHATTIEWPADKAGHGIGGKGNQGVAAAIQNTPYAIGYVEYSYATANNLPLAQMVNKAGKTVTASPDSVKSAMTDFASSFTPQLTAVIVNGGGDGSWPIAGYTYTILHMTSMTDCVKAQKLVEFVHWFLTDSGAVSQATTLGFVPLPDPVLQQVLSKLDQVTCNGQTLLK